MKEIERKLNDLREYGEERVRLTKHLQKVLAEVAEAIASPLEDGSSVQVGKYRIFVKEYQSNIGSYKTLTISETEGLSMITCMTEKFFLVAITDIPYQGIAVTHEISLCGNSCITSRTLFFANHLEEV